MRKPPSKIFLSPSWLDFSSGLGPSLRPIAAPPTEADSASPDAGPTVYAADARDRKGTLCRHLSGVGAEAGSSVPQASAFLPPKATPPRAMTVVPASWRASDEDTSGRGWTVTAALRAKSVNTLFSCINLQSCS